MGIINIADLSYRCPETGVLVSTTIKKLRLKTGYFERHEQVTTTHSYANLYVKCPSCKQAHKIEVKGE